MYGPISTPAPPNSAASDDAALVARCLAGERQAWNTLVKRYQRLVYAIVMRMGMDEHDAADVFQTVFSRLMKHMARIEDPSRLQAWIVTTAKREALHQRKLAQRTISIHGDDDSEPWDMADEGPTAEQSLEHLQQVHMLRLALDQLDERCRGLLMQLFADEDEALSYQEIAQRLGTPVGSIGPTRSRCLDKLRRLMTGQDAPAAVAALAASRRPAPARPSAGVGVGVGAKPS